MALTPTAPRTSHAHVLEDSTPSRPSFAPVPDQDAPMFTNKADFPDPATVPYYYIRLKDSVTGEIGLWWTNDAREGWYEA